MKKLEGEPAGIECLSGQVDQYRGVFPDGIKKYGIFKLADGIPENVNAFCLQLLKLAESANAEITEANYPSIRLFQVKKNTSVIPLSERSTYLVTHVGKES